ncbi:MAG: tetratricopeptide repeat protein [Bdellovibrionales bacterium]|nr:tetratricopeptide repeat protein [Bdellovibrionales bacterium]
MKKHLGSWLYLALIVVAGALAYHNSFHGAFVLDDERHIQQNLYITTLWPPWRSMLAPINAARPIVGLTFAINYAISGLDVWSYHVFALIFHIGAALLMFGTLRRLIRHPRAEQLAFAAAVLWVVHPLNTQAVSYITQRFQSLMGFFFVASVYAFVRSFDGQGIRAKYWQRWCLAGALLSMGCKEDAVVLPILILVLDALCFSDGFKSALKQRAHFYELLASTWIFPLVMHWIAPRSFIAGVGGSFELPWWRYLLTEIGVIQKYLQLAIWPRHQAFDYLWLFAADLRGLETPIVVVGGFFASTLYFLIRRRRVAFLGVWFFLGLAISSSVIPIADPIWEYRMYVPLMAVCAGAVLLVDRLLQKMPEAPAQAFKGVLLVALGALLVHLSVRRNELYKDPVALWSDVTDKQPWNVKAWSSLGVSWDRKGNLDKAEECYRRSIAISPDYFYAHHNLGDVLVRRGKVAEAVEQFKIAISLQDAIAISHMRLAEIYQKFGNISLAVEEYDRALKYHPDEFPALNNKGTLLLALGRAEEAEAMFRMADSVAPNSIGVWYNLGNALAQQQKNAEALTYFERVLNRDPNYFEARNSIGAVMFNSGRIDAAEEQFLMSLKIKPGNPTAIQNLELVRRERAKKK